MVESIRVNGWIIIWRGMGCIRGLMEGSMKENIKMIRNMGMEFTLGLIQDSTKDGGTKANNMV